jgi:hypothetical protein
MEEPELARLAELVKTDPDFRTRFNADPKAAAASVGIDLSQEDFHSLRGGLDDELGITAEWPPD